MSAASDSQSAPAAPNPAAPVRPLLWSLRREVWEHPALYLAPLAVAALYVLPSLLTAITLGRVPFGHMDFRISTSGGTIQDLTTSAQMATLPYRIGALAIFGCGQIVAWFYCLGALHNERRDRSILFWKSLPVSDLTTVLAKVAVPMLLTPVVTFAIVLVSQALMLVLRSVASIDQGWSAIALVWAQWPLGPSALVTAWTVVAVALWWAPIYAWLLLASAWARRAPFLWAILTPMAAGLVENVSFGTHFVGHEIAVRIGGVLEAAFTADPNAILPDPAPGRFFSDPQLWVGLAVAVGLLAVTVRLRRSREPV